MCMCLFIIFYLKDHLLEYLHCIIYIYIYIRCHYCFVFLHMHVLNQGGGAAGATCVLMCQYDVPAERAFQWALSLLTHIKPKR